PRRQRTSHGGRPADRPPALRDGEGPRGLGRGLAESLQQEAAFVDDVTDGVVRAAGGLVVRNAGGEPQVLLVHRPKYDDWSLPKGKADPGETDEETAAREVEEETGLRCRLGVELPAVEYHDRYGRPKRVRYWLMEPEDATGKTAN